MALFSWALDRLFGNHDNPYENLKFDGSAYDRALAKSLNVTNTIYDAKIAETANKSAQAGSVAGVANTTRLSADTYADITSQRDSKIAGITAEIENQRANSETAFNNKKQELSAQFEQQRPGFFDFLASDLGIASSVIGGVSAIKAINQVGATARNIGAVTGFGQNILNSLSGKKSNYQGGGSSPSAIGSPTVEVPQTTEGINTTSPKVNLGNMYDPNLFGVGNLNPRKKFKAQEFLPFFTTGQ